MTGSWRERKAQALAESWALRDEAALDDVARRVASHVPSEGWASSAACKGATPLMFPETEDGYGVAREICGGCPVALSCLAARLGERHGCVAGTSPDERTRLRVAMRELELIPGRPGRPVGTHREPCGTPAAYNRHLRHGEQPCGDCRAARAADRHIGGRRG